MERLSEQRVVASGTEGRAGADPVAREGMVASRVFRVVMLVVLLLLLGRAGMLMLVKGGHYAGKARRNVVREREIQALRGKILDRRGEVLVDNRPAFSLFVTPAFVRDLAKVTRALGAALQLEAKEREGIAARLRRIKGRMRYRATRLRRNLTRNQVARIESRKFELGAAVEVVAETVRHYRRGKLAAHMMGRLGQVGRKDLAREARRGVHPQIRLRAGDLIGRQGIERSYDLMLRGRKGVRRTVVDAKGRRVPKSVARAVLKGQPSLEPPVPGRSIVLTIDAELQAAAEKRLTSTGALVALNPQTGAVLAAVSYPTYDPRLFVSGMTRSQWRSYLEDPGKPLMDKTVQAAYFPGSVYKVITALKGLEEGYASIEGSLPCRGSYRFAGRAFRDHTPKGHGAKVTLLRALKHSCDIYFYRLGEVLGIDSLAQCARRFGLGERTGYDGNSEVTGLVPNRRFYQRRYRKYQPGFDLNTAIGQGDTKLTPMQITLVYAALANGGKLFRPRAAGRVVDFRGRVVKKLGPVVRRDVKIKPKHRNALIKGLIAVVHSKGGTAHRARPRRPGVIVAGKTGTAQLGFIRRDRRPSGPDPLRATPPEKEDHAWFVGFSPPEKSEIVVTVIVEHGGHGGQTAAPLSIGTIEDYFRIKAARGGRF